MSRISSLSVATLLIVGIFAVSWRALAQAPQGQPAVQQQVFISQKAGPGPVAIGAAGFGERFGPPVQGAPYSATMTNETVQTLSDGNRIVQSTSGTIARDSEGRTRQDMNLPAIGNLSASNAPHLVFIHDPVAQTSYSLNLTDKTAQKMPVPPPLLSQAPPPDAGGDFFYVQSRHVEADSAQGPPAVPQIPDMVTAKVLMTDAKGQVATEDLGSQTMQGVYATGVRTTRTIPAGEIGNEQPIRIVTEVWTSPDLKTVVYSKRTDPRMGEQTFQLTSISRSEPDPSLFTVPSDFKVVDGLKPIIYRSNQ
jgi:hypothetical protein